MSRGARLVSAAIWLVVVAGCVTPREPSIPMPVVRFTPSSVERGELLVFLPGIRDAPADFARYGWPGIAAAAGISAETAAVDSHLGYYASQTFDRRLHDDVVGPARARGQKVWLAGISLGGLGALIYAREHPGDIAGVIAVAPFLGDRTILDEIAAAGGLASWQPGPPRRDPRSGTDEFQRELWRYLQRSTGPQAQGVPVWLAFGTSDKLARGHRLLASVLPPERVFTVRGGHDWRTWTNLWRQVAERVPMSRTASPVRVSESGLRVHRP